ncbi:MAG TPA: flavin reductase family protein [Ramlibacter sp.]|nr:flavin reductase family protein [Ramlibacter sp.]
MNSFDPAVLDAAVMAKLMTAVVVPRPIALVTTLGPDRPNAAPFSFFNLVCADPSMVMFSMAPREGTTTAKDTVRNIERLPEFVVHIVDEPNAARMNLCSTEWPHGVDEIARAGFTTEPSVKVRPPRIADCPVQLECRLERFVKLGRKPYTMVIGEIVLAHFRDGLVDPARHHVDTTRLQALGRMESDMYTRLTDRFHLPRPARPPLHRSPE